MLLIRFTTLGTTFGARSTQEGRALGTSGYHPMRAARALRGTHYHCLLPKEAAREEANPGHTANPRQSRALLRFFPPPWHRRFPALSGRPTSFLGSRARPGRSSPAGSPPGLSTPRENTPQSRPRRTEQHPAEAGPCLPRGRSSPFTWRRLRRLAMSVQKKGMADSKVFHRCR